MPTQSNDGKTAYVIFNEVGANQLSFSKVLPKDGSKIYLLGQSKPLTWTKKDGFVVVELPKELPGKYAWALKVVIGA